MTTPRHGSDRAARIVQGILSCYDRLSRFETLEPTSELNDVFEQLVGLCSRVLDADTVAEILHHPRVAKVAPHLRQLCSQGEFRLEASWARKIAACQNAEQALEVLHSFPYYSNYSDLTRLELYAIAAVTGGQESAYRRWALIGSGPLPLTSLCLTRHLENGCCQRVVRCCNIDKDAQAVSLSSQVSSTLGLSADRFSIRQSDVGHDDVDLYDFDVVCLAALVGENYEDKQRLLGDIVRQMRPGALLVLRTANSLRQLLYPSWRDSESLVLLGLTPLLTVHPHNHIVNSIIVARNDKSVQVKLD